MSGLSVIIPSRTLSNLTPCVAAVRVNEPDARIIVVDDGLPWECFDVQRASYLFADRVEGIQPFCFGRNVNLGIQAAGSDDVVVLNDDALLKTPGGFTVMQHAAEDYPEFGLIASTCHNVGNVNQHPHPKRIGLREDPRMVCFVAVLIPRRTIDQVGLLDERYVNYGCEDDDYCAEVRQSGLKIGIHDGCYVDHGSLNSSFRGKAGAGGDYRPNLKRFIQKWGVDNWGRTKERSQFKELF